MQSTAGALLGPSWRGIAGSQTASNAFRRFQPNFALMGRGSLQTRRFQHGMGSHSEVTPVRCSGSDNMMPVLGVYASDFERGLSGGLSGLTAFGQPGADGKVEQRRGVRTRAGRGLLGAVKEVKNPVIEKDLEFESPLDIVLYPDPRLRAKNAAVKQFDSKLEALCKEMFDVMYRTDGVGLSAPQVGVNFRVMVYNPEGVKGEGVEYVLVNPKIVSSSKKEDVFAEGCLSFPKIEADVVRPLDVKVQAQNLQGKRFSLTLKGWKARIFQHEYDHLEGILFHDRMAEDVRDGIRGQLLELEKAYTERTGLEPPETVLKG